MTVNALGAVPDLQFSEGGRAVTGASGGAGGGLSLPTQDAVSVSAKEHLTSFRPIFFKMRQFFCIVGFVLGCVSHCCLCNCSANG